MAELGRPGPDHTPWDRLVGFAGQHRSSRWAQGVALVLVAVVVLGAWSLLRRPPSASMALPRALDSTSGASNGAARPSASKNSGSRKSGSKASTSTTLLEPNAKGAGSGGTGLGGTGSATVTTGAGVTVHVAGAVLRPGVVTLASGSRAIDAIDAAGGLAPGADADRINLAAPLVDGVRLVVPLIGQPAAAEVAPQRPAGTSTGAPGSTSSSGSAPVGPVGPVDLNTADATQLDALPGVGPSTAAAIIAYRDEHGPFTSIDGLLDVRGIGDAKLDGLRDLVTIGS